MASNISSDEAGVHNYVEFRDFRRYLDQIWRREGHDYFFPNTSLPVGTQPFPTGVTDRPITLVHHARRPNGSNAVIVGIPETLYRYFGLEQGAYFEGNGTLSAYFEEPPLPNTPYYDDNPGNWIIIGRDFTLDAQRWEAVSINGWSIFNNGVDLPVSYRVEDSFSIPMYELREAGVAAVGCIAEFFGILMLGDISEIQAEKLEELFDPIGILRSGAMVSSQTGNTVTTPDDFFSVGDVGRTIVFDDGTITEITAFVSAQEVTVSDTQTVTSQRFKLRTRAIQNGSTYSGMVTANQPSGSQTVTSSAAFFNAGMVGKQLRYINGWRATITLFTDPQNVDVDTPSPEAFTGMPFYIVSLPEPDGVTPAGVDFQVTVPAALFTPDMVGRSIFWEDGTERRIVRVIDAFTIEVDYDIAIPPTMVGIDNPDTYATYTKNEFINRIGYRLMWSMNEMPTRFDPVYKGSIEAGTRKLILSNPARSFEVGQSVVIEGAGVSGGNLTAEILYVAAHFVLTLDTLADTTVTRANVQKADALESISGFEDLQDDSSGIVKMLELSGHLVIYKDTAVVLARYTGDIDAPFQFNIKRIPSTKTLYYRNTLVMVNSEYHLYAGRSSFYRFDLTNQFPAEAMEFELCKDIFFSKAILENSRWIWAADNFMTKEIVVGMYPWLGQDRVLCYDYLSGPPGVSTSSMNISAGASVKQPESTLSSGETPDWFVMGTPMGAVLIYGLVFEPNPSWSNEKSITYRREANPFSDVKTGYQSRKTSGLGDFGNAFSEKDIRSWVMLLASQSLQTPVLFELFGARSTEDGITLLATKTVISPETLVPLWFRKNYYQDRITVDGIDNPIKIRSRIFEMSGVNSKAFIRRPLIP